MSRWDKIVSGLSEVAPQIKGTLESWAKEYKTLDPVKDKARMQVLSDNMRSTAEANAHRGTPQGPEKLSTTNQPAITKSDSGNILIPGEGKSAADLLQESRQVRAGDVLKEGFQDPLQRDLKRLNDYDAMTKTKPDMKKVAAALAAQNPFQNPDGSSRDLMAEHNKAVSDTGSRLVNRFLPDSSPENKALAQKTFEVVANPMNLVGGAGLADLAMGAVEIAPEAYEAGKARFKGLFGK